MSENDKPERPKPLVWIRDEGIAITEDQANWRVEGTIASRRVKELTASVRLWWWLTIVTGVGCLACVFMDINRSIYRADAELLVGLLFPACLISWIAYIVSSVRLDAWKGER